MLLMPVLSDVHQSLPLTYRSPEWLNRVLVGLTDGRHFAVLSSVKDPSVWMPAQGPVPHNLTLAEAARQVLRTEIPSVQRPHRHAPPLVDWNGAIYVGSALNPHARCGLPKFVHGVLVRTKHTLVLRADPSVAVATHWVSSNEDLEDLLGAAVHVNRDKSAIVMEMAFAAHQRGWLL
jgi:hypothetical protein